MVLTEAPDGLRAACSPAFGVFPDVGAVLVLPLVGRGGAVFDTLADLVVRGGRLAIDGAATTTVPIEVENAIAFPSGGRESFDHASPVAMVLPTLHYVLLHHQELVLLDLEPSVRSCVRTSGQESTLRSLTGATVHVKLLRVVLVLATAAVLSVRGGLLVRDLDRKHLGVRVATLSCKRVLSALLELGFEVVLDAIGTAVHVRSVMMLNRLLLHRSGVLV